MLLLYISCLIFGGIFVMLSLLLGHDSNGEMDFHSEGGLAIDSHDLPSEEGVIAAAEFLSLRNVIFFLAFFGLTGSTLSLLAIPTLLTLPTSIGMGIFAAFLRQKLMSYLRKTEVGELHHLSELEGFKGRVIVNLSRTARGKISIPTKERTLQLLAMVAEEASKDEFQYGETVTIVRVDNGVAFVVEEDFIN